MTIEKSQMRRRRVEFLYHGYRKSTKCVGFEENGRGISYL